MVASLLEALVHAHAAGVLHRDIKPENIMVTGDHLGKLLDFGIAQLHERGTVDSEEKTEVALTEAGAVIGTLGYMSPEQLRGKPLDERSDLFSLGAVLYETLAGRPAFPGDNPADRIAANLSAEFEPLAAAGVPADAAVVLTRAMARDPERRYPSAAAFLAELRALGSGELLASLPDTLAIVDFRNLSRNPDDDWIGSGFAESLAVDLSRLPGVSLVPRDAVRRAAAEAGEQGRPLGQVLGCRWVLSGAYQRAGQHLRVTSQLADGITGDTVASEKVDGSVDEMFSMQDRLSAAAADRLRPGGAAPAVRPAPRIDVYERYERGRRFFHRLEKGSLDQAQALFEEAVAADAAYAPALAGLVAVHCMRFPYQTDPRELEIAESYARRAIAADATLAEPRDLARVRPGADGPDRGSGRAGSGAPWSSTRPACTRLTSAASGWRRPDVRTRPSPLFQRTVQLDPLHGFAWLALGWSHLELGHAAEAQWCLEKAVALEGQQGKGPTSGAACYLGECLRRLGELDRARARCLEGLATVERSDFMYRDTFRGVGLCALGRTAVEQRDVPAAGAAFAQAVAHLRGRPRSLGGGHLLVQALAGLARAGSGDAPYDEALALFRHARAGTTSRSCGSAPTT